MYFEGGAPLVFLLDGPDSCLLHDGETGLLECFSLLIDLQPFDEATVAVLDHVFIAVSTGLLGDGRPPHPVLHDALQHPHVFLGRPWTLVQLRVAVVFPSVAAIFRGLEESPRRLSEELVADLLPSVLALPLFGVDAFQEYDFFGGPLGICLGV
jgi:hypothetical protein